MSKTTDTGVTVRAVHPDDHEAWATLFRGYRDFYHQPDNDAAIDAVWGWLHDPEHEMRGLVAEAEGVVIGLAHFQSFARPLLGSRGLFLDDLFTAPERRGIGAGTLLLHAVSELATAEGATVVRWITNEDNAPARRIYDREATQTAWITYDLVPG